METSKCPSCGAAVIRATSAESRQIMVLDAEPHPEGTIVLTPAGAKALPAEEVAFQRRVEKGLGSVAQLFRSHFDTCPQATTVPA